MIGEQELDEKIAELKREVKKNKLKYAKVHESYKKYEIFYENHRLTRLGLSESLVFVIRRCVFIASALYWTEGNYVLLAIACFVLSAYAKLIFNITVRPFTDSQLNFTEGVNELFVVGVGYFAIPLMDQSLPREQILAVGSVIAKIIYAMLIFSVLCLLTSLAVQIRIKIKKTAFEKVIKSRSGRAMLQKVQQKGRDQVNAQILDQLKRKPHDDFRIKLIECELLFDPLIESCFSSQKKDEKFKAESVDLSELEVDVAEPPKITVEKPLTQDESQQPYPAIKLAEIGVVSTKTKQEKYRRSVYRAMGREDDSESSGSFESEDSSAFA